MSTRIACTRREFIETALAGAAIAAGALAPAPLLAAEEKRRLRKAVKYGMIKVPGASIEDKFKLIKSLGFEGVEVDSPGNLDRDEAARAHWQAGELRHVDVARGVDLPEAEECDVEAAARVEVELRRRVDDRARVVHHEAECRFGDAACHMGAFWPGASVRADRSGAGVCRHFS